AAPRPSIQRREIAATVAIRIMPMPSTTGVISPQNSGRVDRLVHRFVREVNRPRRVTGSNVATCLGACLWREIAQGHQLSGSCPSRRAVVGPDGHAGPSSDGLSRWRAEPGIPQLLRLAICLREKKPPLFHRSPEPLAGG